MKNFIVLVCAVEYIENNLRERLTVGDVAQASFVSLSHLQSMFSRVFRLSLGDYITKRRLCIAAFDLTNTDKSVTDIAFDFGYANVESFSRAFKRQFRCSPSAYRREHRFSALYPRLIIHEKEGFDMIQRYDLTEISEKILAAKGTYIICVDIDNLMHINSGLGHIAGDAAIAQTAIRIGKSIAPGMDYFRIGADSFVVLTGSHTPDIPESIAKQILQYAPEKVSYKHGEFTFSVSMGIVMIPLDISDAETAIKKSDAAMIAAKKDGRNCYKIV